MVVTSSAFLGPMGAISFQGERKPFLIYIARSQPIHIFLEGQSHRWSEGPSVATSVYSKFRGGRPNRKNSEGSWGAMPGGGGCDRFGPC